MLDSQLLRENPQFVASQLLKRGFKFDVAAFSALEEQRKALQVDFYCRNPRNQYRTRYALV